MSSLISNKSKSSLKPLQDGNNSVTNKRESYKQNKYTTFSDIGDNNLKKNFYNRARKDETNLIYKNKINISDDNIQDNKNITESAANLNTKNNQSDLNMISDMNDVYNFTLNDLDKTDIVDDDENVENMYENVQSKLNDSENSLKESDLLYKSSSQVFDLKKHYNSCKLENYPSNVDAILDNPFEEKNLKYFEENNKFLQEEEKKVEFSQGENTKNKIGGFVTKLNNNISLSNILEDTKELKDSDNMSNRIDELNNCEGFERIYNVSKDEISNIFQDTNRGNIELSKITYEKYIEILKKSSTLDLNNNNNIQSYRNWSNLSNFSLVNDLYQINFKAQEQNLTDNLSLIKFNETESKLNNDITNKESITDYNNMELLLTERKIEIENNFKENNNEDIREEVFDEKNLKKNHMRKDDNKISKILFYKR